MLILERYSPATSWKSSKKLSKTLTIQTFTNERFSHSRRIFRKTEYRRVLQMKLLTTIADNFIYRVS